MTSLLFSLIWMISAITGANPCDNAAFAEAHTDECEQTDTPSVHPKKRESTASTDISNGF